jgi:hypothetical protein
MNICHREPCLILSGIVLLHVISVLCLRPIEHRGVFYTRIYLIRTYRVCPLDFT